MSLQKCHCGWSKETTEHGLRIHQGKMGCKNRLEEGDQPKHQPAKTGAVKKEGEPLLPGPNSHTTAAEIEPEYEPLPAPPPRSSQTDTIPKLRRPLQDSSTDMQKNRSIEEHPTFPEEVRPRENDQTSSEFKVRQDRIRVDVKREIQMREQKLAQARSSVNACKDIFEAQMLELSTVISEVMRIAEDTMRKSLDRPFFKLRTTMSTMMEQIQQKLEKLAAIDKLNTSDMSLQVCHCGWSKVTTYHGLRTHQGKMGCTPRGMSIPESDQFRFSSYRPVLTYQGPPIEVEEPYIFTPPLKSGSQQNTGVNRRDSRPLNWTTPVRTENVPVSPYLTTTFPATDDALVEMVKSMMGRQILDRTDRVRHFADGAQSLLRPVSQIFSTQVKPAAVEVTGKETDQSAFQTPPHDSATHQTTGNARRALDFSTSAQQVGRQVLDIPTTTAQETVRPKEREQEKEKKEKEDQKLQKARQDRMRADLQQNIQTREQKMAKVRSSVKACKGGLDAEWLQINNVFSEVMRVVEDTRQKALQPLEERRKRAKREAQDLVQKLQKEIDELKMTIDELDKNPDLVSPQTGLGKTCDWRNVTVDTLFSFGTLRSTTSNMMQEIQQELDKLSSVELKRIPTFAVDVKLDPTTAHPCLVLSPDMKTVRDGGESQKVPDAPDRFDTFGSVLGLDALSSGKSYWEVEVGNKTGWDLGVARRGANRKGKLPLNPDGGYWVIVHYEEEKYAAMAAPPTLLSLTGKPQKVGVFVDYEEGLVSFYHVTAKSHIYSFTECSFSDKVFPYFSPHLKQNEINTHPLIISAVKQQQ